MLGATSYNDHVFLDIQPGEKLLSHTKSLTSPLGHAIGRFHPSIDARVDIQRSIDSRSDIFLPMHEADYYQRYLGSQAYPLHDMQVLTRQHPKW